ncbi:hypothetical protein [Microbulbifer sp. SSSA005]|uniref:hypothetical protein n=1 Tax=Microbulbifer sp. SSSA005 TaxID=3243378 RepID=UPI0040399BBF
MEDIMELTAATTIAATDTTVRDFKSYRSFRAKILAATRIEDSLAVDSKYYDELLTSSGTLDVWSLYMLQSLECMIEASQTALESLDQLKESLSEILRLDADSLLIKIRANTEVDETLATALKEGLNKYGTTEKWLLTLRQALVSRIEISEEGKRLVEAIQEGRALERPQLFPVLTYLHDDSLALIFCLLGGLTMKAICVVTLLIALAPHSPSEPPPPPPPPPPPED